MSIPNDPTNEGRALVELARLGWIEVKPGIQTSRLTLNVIVKNPKGIQLIELEAPQLPRSMDDTDVAVINAGYAISAGLNSQRDGLFSESTETSPYVNVIAGNGKRSGLSEGSRGLPFARSDEVHQRNLQGCARSELVIRQHAFGSRS